MFQALAGLAVEELAAVADALMAPVRLGVARPTAPFALLSMSAHESLQVGLVGVFFGVVIEVG